MFVCTRKRLIKKSFPSARVTLLIAVVIVQLQVPVPVVHDHDAVDSHVTLVDHIDRHHQEELGEDGVHWHWVLPRSSDGSNESADPSLPTPCHGSHVVSSLSPPTDALASIHSFSTDLIFPLDSMVAGSGTSRCRIAASSPPPRSKTPTYVELCVIRC